MSQALYLRFAGAQQTWAGKRVDGMVTNTNPKPTRSGIEGLLAGALGLPRGEIPAWFAELDVAVRVDKAGHTLDDFQVISPRVEQYDYLERLYWLTYGTKPTKSSLLTPDGQHGTAILKRTFLSDAEFIVRIMNDDHVEQLNQAVCSPTFVTYLGRKAYPPDFPFYLGMGKPGQIKALPTYIPLRKNREKYTDQEPPSEHWVTIYYLDPFGGEQRESAVAIPRTGDRAEWLEQVGSALTRRQFSQDT